MRAWSLLVIGIAIGPFPVGHAQDPCIPTSADPATITQFNDPLTGNTFYFEERDSGVPTIPPMFGSGFLTGGGTWIYQEVNGLWELQRGGTGPLLGRDPIDDEHCGWGPDAIIAGLYLHLGPTILPVSVVGAGSVTLGCAGTVQLTFGASVPVLGVSLGPSGCAESPCQIYSNAGLTCTPNPIGCCFPFGVPSPGASFDILCVRKSELRVDANADGFWDLVLPTVSMTAPDC